MKATVRSHKQRTLDSDLVLRYSPKPASRSTVRRHYAAWREANAIQPRCDIEPCVYFSSPLLWAGKKLPLILDHINGNNRDNSPNNLRYICPNCDSQLLTRGGANRGRVLEAEDGTYVLAGPDGSRDRFIIASTAQATATGFEATAQTMPGVPQT